MFGIHVRVEMRQASCRLLWKVPTLFCAYTAVIHKQKSRSYGGTDTLLLLAGVSTPLFLACGEAVIRQQYEYYSEQMQMSIHIYVDLEKALTVDFKMIIPISLIAGVEQAYAWVYWQAIENGENGGTWWGFIQVCFFVCPLVFFYFADLPIVEGGDALALHALQLLKLLNGRVAGDPFGCNGDFELTSFALPALFLF